MRAAQQQVHLPKEMPDYKDQATRFLRGPIARSEVAWSQKARLITRGSGWHEVSLLETLYSRMHGAFCAAGFVKKRRVGDMLGAVSQCHRPPKAAVEVAAFWALKLHRVFQATTGMSTIQGRQLPRQGQEGVLLPSPVLRRFGPIESTANNLVCVSCFVFH